MFITSAVLLIIWFILKFAIHKGGYVHMLLLAAIALFVVQLATERKTRYQRSASRR